MSKPQLFKIVLTLAVLSIGPFSIFLASQSGHDLHVDITPMQLQQLLESRQKFFHLNDDENSQHLRLFIGFTTSYTTNSVARRQAIRDTWLKYNTSWAGMITYRFFLGQKPTDASPLSQKELEYGDIVILDGFTDTYKNLSHKVQRLCLWATEHYNFDFLLRSDDDIYIRLPSYVNWLRQQKPVRFWAGRIYAKFFPQSKGKWAVQKGEYREGLTDIKRCDGALTYTMSFDLVKKLGRKSHDPSWPQTWMEDINTSYMMYDEKVSPVEYPLELGYADNAYCKPSIWVVHYCTPEMMPVFYNSTIQFGLVCKLWCAKRSCDAEVTNPALASFDTEIQWK